jgi:hypothetical protein
VDLDRFRADYCPEMGPTIPTPDFDYDFRAYVEPTVFAAAISAMVLDITYLKFKPEAQDDELHSVYNSIWSVMLRMSKGTSKYTRPTPSLRKTASLPPVAPVQAWHGPWSNWSQRLADEAGDEEFGGALAALDAQREVTAMDMEELRARRPFRHRTPRRWLRWNRRAYGEERA